MKAKRLLITAMEIEATSVGRALGRGITPLKLGHRDYLAWIDDSGSVVIVATGVGPKAAEQGLLRALADLKPIGVAVGFGFAGGLTKSAQTGDLIMPTKVLFGRDEELPTEWLRMALSCRLDRPPLRTLLTSATLVTSTVEKAGLFAATGAEAVDMESAVWGTVLKGEGIPWAIVRAVLDTADEPLPGSFAAIADRFGRARPWKAASRLLLHPSELAAALKLRRACEQASSSLGEVLRPWVDSPGV